MIDILLWDLPLIRPIEATLDIVWDVVIEAVVRLLEWPIEVTLDLMFGVAHA